MTQPTINGANQIQMDLANLADVNSTPPTSGQSLVWDSSTNEWVPGQASAKNLLLNGAFDIWQRGTSFPISGTAEYTADRFLAARSSSVGGYTVSRVGGNTSFYGIKMQRDSGNTLTEGVYLNYYMETVDVIPLVGKNIVCKIRIKAGADLSDPTINVSMSTASTTDSTVSKNSSGTISSGDPDYNIVTQNVTPTTSFVDYELDMGVVDANANIINFRVRFLPTGTAGADDSITIDRLQFEVGETASDFEYRQHGDELTLCQRYFNDMNSILMNLRDPNALTEMSLVQFRVPTMRVTPTETFTFNSPVTNSSSAPSASRIQIKAKSIDNTERSVQDYTADAEI